MDERALLLAQAAAYNAGMPKKKKGNLFTSALPTIGGIVGGIGGSFLAPGAGTLAGGAGGAALGKTLQNALEGEDDLGQGVIGEAALGTLGGIGKGFRAIKGATGALRSGEGVGRAGQILKMGVPGNTAGLSRTGAKVEEAGSKMIASQGQVTGAQARSMNMNPTQTFASVNKRTGLTNLDDMAELSRSLTGSKDGFLDMLTREAVGGTTGVAVPDLRKRAAALLDDAGSIIPDEKRKQLLQNATRAGASMRGGSKGTLSSLADPQGALDVANSFRATARSLTTGFTVDGEKKQLGRAYNALAKDIEDSIYKSPGVNDSIPVLVKAGSDDLMFKAQDLAAAGKTAQAKAMEKVAMELRGVKDTAGLRSMKKDFVNIGKIDQATAQAQGSRTISGADTANSLRNPFSMIGMGLEAATPAAGGAMSRAGRALQGGLPGMATSTPAKIAGTQLLGRAATGTLPGADVSAETPTDPLASQMMMPGAVDPTAALGGAPPDTGSIYTKDAVAQDIQRDLQTTGGKNMDKYISLYEFLNADGAGGSGGKVNATTQKALAQSANADSTLSQLESMLQSAGGASGPIGGRISSLFGNAGMNNTAKTYNDLVSGSVTQIAKSLGETGAMSDADRAAYMNLLPKITDTSEVAQAKFQALRQRMAAAQENTLQYGSGSGIEEALAAAGY